MIFFSFFLYTQAYTYMCICISNIPFFIELLKELNYEKFLLNMLKVWGGEGQILIKNYKPVYSSLV